ncbi:3'-5' exonuclease [Apibacter adventoris]|uniref:DNA polymerase III subunit epsilon n=1 Tax=Apibacter adventoris TaxID=1679466 RepID=A0A2S8AE86_9FLAO|nr:3'-5' exonuclease [Apibacter adventoris]PQL93200.1 DNA polymerase III subunit epsilon [Apibacter adventoris]PQL95867.1 DNA polymerase III subunit epsilon [Apibacter adventoris]
MELKLHKPICFFDLETTGINVSKDRIVEISILKISPNQSQESKTWRINPQIPIPEESSLIHGIYDKDVINAPTFKEIAPQILGMIKDSDLAGYNSNRFDIPLLAEELLRNDFEFDIKKHRPIDVQVIYHKLEPRTLSAAYKFYCDGILENAHSASADTLATYEVLKSQIEKYDEIENDIKFLHEFTTQNKNADLAGFVGLDKENDEIFNFGKYRGKKLKDIFKTDLGYYSWLMNADFPLYSKKIFTRIKLKNGL